MEVKNEHASLGTRAQGRQIRSGALRDSFGKTSGLQLPTVATDSDRFDRQTSLNHLFFHLVAFEVEVCLLWH